ncbi:MULTISPECIES: hypothetical protein [Bacillus cereus group]|uniref:hypothetical protein n=1 Tax=Bacillus cereus group TaxID=86661 RepID=UPI0008FDF921|nr:MULTISPECIES: hypothetical protein [Bacillus cereus group]MDG1622930.1 hypothetical protein [Bacillus mobilis]MDX5837500.1 hypothetical protein [Bacillus cereus group sp. BfR-BA-01700]MED4383672.1 hypothetical protein [Bacillus mobilis]OJE37522.1 hypothetical protein BAQ44_13720 [Bacillus mobilis]HDR7244284.1 hypothetical protein [Bacillus mobilis]
MKKIIAILFTCSFLLLGVHGMVEAEDSSKEVSYIENNANKIFENPKVFYSKIKNHTYSSFYVPFKEAENHLQKTVLYKDLQSTMESEIGPWVSRTTGTQENPKINPNRQIYLIASWTEKKKSFRVKYLIADAETKTTLWTVEGKGMKKTD